MVLTFSKRISASPQPSDAGQAIVGTTSYRAPDTRCLDYSKTGYRCRIEALAAPHAMWEMRIGNTAMKPGYLLIRRMGWPAAARVLLCGSYTISMWRWQDRSTEFPCAYDILFSFFSSAVPAVRTTGINASHDMGWVSFCCSDCENIGYECEP